MIQGYHQMKMRSNLLLRFKDYKQDWEHKDKIAIGYFIPQIEIDEVETRLLCEMCEHAAKFNSFQTLVLNRIKKLKNLLVSKLERFQAPEMESCETLLDSEEQLDTLLFVIEESRKEIRETKVLKGQITFGF
jgi:hypothetical protein